MFSSLSRIFPAITQRLRTLFKPLQPVKVDGAQGGLLRVVKPQKPEPPGSEETDGKVFATDSHELLRTRFAKEADAATIAAAEASRRCRVPNAKALGSLQSALGYQFSNESLLVLALVHHSANLGASNNRLAWVGDTVLNTVAIEYLLSHFQKSKLGDVCLLKNWLVSRAHLLKKSADLQLDKHALVTWEFLTLGKPLQTSPMVFAEMTEAVLGAVYVDGGTRSVRAVFPRLFPLSMLEYNFRRLRHKKLTRDGAASTGAAYWFPVVRGKATRSRIRLRRRKK